MADDKPQIVPPKAKKSFWRKIGSGIGAVGNAVLDTVIAIAMAGKGGAD
jgi:hypothetical protein